MANRYKIKIAGAGLGGLTAAACLLKDGHDVEVFEQAPSLGEVGAGIQVSANASRVLRHLGVLDELKKTAVRPERIEFRLHQSAEVVSTLQIGEGHEAKFGAPYYHVYRPDLHAVLAEKVEMLKPGAIKLGKTVTGYKETESGVDLSLADGETRTGDVLIGADGIKSVVRAQMHGDEPANFTGNVAWRFMVPVEKLPEDFMPPIFVNWMGPEKHAVVYWVRGGKLLNVVACVEKPEWTHDGWTVKAPWEDLSADYEGWHAEFRTIIDAADRDSCYCWALNTRPRLPFWSTGRVTLMGDSAHPTLPYMAQGAVMAIEDAAVLSRALNEVDDIGEALERYQAARIDRTARIVDESTAHAKLYHHRTPQEFRDAFAAKDPASDRAKWLYNYDPLSTPI